MPDTSPSPLQPDTLQTEPAQIFDSPGLPVPPGTKARLRPIGWPRVIVGPGESSVAIFDEVATPVPPGTRARSRPPGRERWGSIPQPAQNNGPTTLAVGDLVALRSGGPAMTVIGFSAAPNAPGPQVAPADHVWCAWFNNGECRREVLPLAAVVPASKA